jgi:hypothetical protein
MTEIGITLRIVDDLLGESIMLGVLKIFSCKAFTRGPPDIEELTV